MSFMSFLNFVMSGDSKFDRSEGLACFFLTIFDIVNEFSRVMSGCISVFGD